MYYDASRRSSLSAEFFCSYRCIWREVILRIARIERNILRTPNACISHAAWRSIQTKYDPLPLLQLKCDYRRAWLVSMFWEYTYVIVCPCLSAPKLTAASHLQEPQGQLHRPAPHHCPGLRAVPRRRAQKDCRRSEGRHAAQRAVPLRRQLMCVHHLLPNLCMYLR